MSPRGTRSASRAAHNPVDGGALNSERGLAECIPSRATHRLLHRLLRRMISAALGAGTLLQFSAWVREMRIWTRAPQ